MAVWTTPRTWVTGEIVTSSIGNVHWRDNLSFLYGDRDFKNTVKDVANTAAETDLLNAEWTALGGILTTTGWLRAILYGDLLYNRNVADTIAVRVSLGGTDLYYSGTTTAALLPPLALSANRGAWRMELDFTMQNATNAITMNGLLALGWRTNAPTTGLGDMSAMLAPSTFGSNGAVTIDMTTNKTFTVKVTWSTASASNSFRLQGAQFQSRNT